MSNSFLDIFKKVLLVFETTAPLAAAVLAVIPGGQLPAALVAIINLIPRLCEVAETLLGPDKGTAKKDMVMSMVGVAMQSIKANNPQITADEWAKLEATVPVAIENTIAQVKLAQIQSTAKA